ncbi:CAMPATH-1 antigen [Pteronotus mesoamericanus]|uniref:CAMPATH-1 antigen n=1 Tax=Pteronotus mesoamericanus TaxID=1884717 RepID=UPI0023EBC6CC|nr:CAMPATH-1 antigen [Pteronotus parnellii mesoamericanus]
MKGFFFLLFTISLLVMLQIQSGMLQNATNTVTLSAGASSSTGGEAPRHSSSSSSSSSATTIITTTTTTTTAAAASKKHAGGAAALSSLGSVNVLIILTNALIHLLHLS